MGTVGTQDGGLNPVHVDNEKRIPHETHDNPQKPIRPAWVQKILQQFDLSSERSLSDCKVFTCPRPKLRWREGFLQGKHVRLW